MDVTEGYAYHIKDEYFVLAQDGKLMKNKEGDHMRPTFFCLRDPKTSLLWMVPMSTQVEKYVKIAEKNRARYGKCTNIVFGDFAGKPNAFLLQNMFPLIDAYIAHPHTVNGNPVPVSYTITQELQSNFRQLMALIRRGKKVVFPDVLRLECLMLQELARKAPVPQPQPPQLISEKLAAAKVQCEQQQAERAAKPKPPLPDHKPPVR